MKRARHIHSYHYQIEVKEGKKWVKCKDYHHKGRFKANVRHRMRRLKLAKIEKEAWI